MPKNNDAILLFWNGHSFRISVTSLEIQNPDSISTNFSDFLAGDQKELYRYHTGGKPSRLTDVYHNPVNVFLESHF